MRSFPTRQYTVDCRADRSPPTDHNLILITATGDLDIARRLVGEAGGSWDAAVIAYGKQEFVDYRSPKASVTRAAVAASSATDVGSGWNAT